MVNKNIILIFLQPIYRFKSKNEFGAFVELKTINGFPKCQKPNRPNLKCLMCGEIELISGFLFAYFVLFADQKPLLAKFQYV